MKQSGKKVVKKASKKLASKRTAAPKSAAKKQAVKRNGKRRRSIKSSLPPQFRELKQLAANSTLLRIRLDQWERIFQLIERGAKMTNEEMERRMEFFDKQQESFADNIQQVAFTLKDVAERQNKFQEEIDKLKLRQDQFQSQLDLLNQATLGLMSLVGSLTESQKRTDEQLKELGGRLDIFINVVERYINENRNGKNRNS